jgi:hypothetical protein
MFSHFRHQDDDDVSECHSVDGAVSFVAGVKIMPKRHSRDLFRSIQVNPAVSH